MGMFFGDKETEDKSESAPCPEAALIHGKPSLQAEGINLQGDVTDDKSCVPL